MRHIAPRSRDIRWTEKACSSRVRLFGDENDVALAGADVVGAEPEVVELVFTRLVRLQTGAEVVLSGRVEGNMLGEDREGGGEGEDDDWEMHIVGGASWYFE